VAASGWCVAVALGSRGCTASQSLVCRCHGDDIGAHSRTNRMLPQPCPFCVPEHWPVPPLGRSPQDRNGRSYRV